jgi:hypothetical protein
MGKRSNFERNPRDYYRTPYEAVEPLFPHIQQGSKYCEPCAGDGRLIQHLRSNYVDCVYACDIEPQGYGIEKMDALGVVPYQSCKYVITNPPWDRKFLHQFINHLMEQDVTAWLLFDADWMHTKQSAEYMKYCSKIVSVGRVKWIPDSKMTGKDNCAWYKFSPDQQYSGQTLFFGR